MHRFSKKAAAGVFLVLALAAASTVAADDWKSLKREAKRLKIDETAKETLDVLLAKSAKAEMLLHHAYGWAVFDNL
ncbi:MAG TPA: hypothetical protein VLT81_16425, partial [Chondromyces sp.]|nr:hypothetical protein [Chondromyces sp.]